jgi:multiple sugar transport system ATP-binding protein
VFDIEDQGVVKVLALDMGETRLHVTVPAGTHVQRDELVRFGWKPDRVVTFDTTTGTNLALI